MFNRELEDEFHYGINDISKYREALDEPPEYKFDCFSFLFIGIEVFLGITGFLLSLFRK